jgi:DNA polymerase elongation subunit (family B)
MFDAVERDARVLDFDCECRPMAWYGGDFVTKQPTAISWKWLNARKTEKPMVEWIGRSHEPDNLDAEETQMIEIFRQFYDEADIVTGHFIRGFDLTLLDGACVRLGLPLLGEKLTSDTKMDFAKAHGISKSQENLGATFELDHPKIPMNTAKWFESNKLTTLGIAYTLERVVGDVVQHIELRNTMLERGLLAGPKIWSPRSSGLGQYTP